MKLIIATGLLILSSTTFAGECVQKIKRDACPGKEAAAYKPYDGKVETTEKSTVGNMDACKKAAEKSAKIVRKGTLSKKTVTYTFDGGAAATASGTSACK